MSYPSALDLHRQAQWEMEGVRRATERYREAAKAADPMTLPAGRRLLRDIVGPLAARIAQEQEQATQALGQPGRQAVWCWPIQMLSSEQLAILTVSAAFRGGLDNEGGDTRLGLTSQAEELAKRIRDQMEFARWEAEQQQATAEAKRRRDTDHEDLLKRLQRAYPQMDRRGWARWRRKVDVVRSEPWGKDVDIAVGAALLKMLVETSPRWFLISERPIRGGGVQYRLALTDEGRETLRDTEARAEVARPMLMPMIIPPNPWTYEAA